MRVFLPMVLAVAAVPMLAAAAPAPVPPDPAVPPPGADARFALEKAPNGGFVRLDRKTGEMSYCTVAGADLDCRAGADERAALQAEIDRLAGEVDRLKGESGADTAEGGNPALRELDRMRAIVEDFIRRVIEIVHDLAPDRPGGGGRADQAG